MAQRAVLSGLCAAVAIAAGAWLAVDGPRDTEAAVPCVSPSASPFVSPPPVDELVPSNIAAANPDAATPALADERQAVEGATSPRVLLRGQLLGTHGMGGEIKLFVSPLSGRATDTANWRDVQLADLNGFELEFGTAHAPFLGNSSLLSRNSEMTQSGPSVHPAIFTNSNYAKLETHDEFVRRAMGSAAALPSLALDVDADGDVEADVSELFANPLTVPTRLLLRIDHPNFGARQVLVACNSLDGHSIDRAALAHGGDFVLPFEVALSAVYIARGQAALCDGSAEQVHIAAWDLVDGRPSTPAGRAETYTANGSFSLQLEPGRDYAVVAYADDTTPQTQFLRTTGALNIDLATFQLERGVSIAGRVELGRHSFGSDAWLSATLDQQPTQREFVIGTDLVWNGSVFERRTNTVQAARDGSFTLSGLTRGRYAIHLGGARDWAPTDTTLIAHAPSSNLLIAPRLVHVTLRVEMEQSPLARHELRVHGVGDCSARSTPMLQTDAHGRVSLWLLPGEQYVVDVPMGERDTRSYGKIVPWIGAELVEVVNMSAH